MNKPILAIIGGANGSGKTSHSKPYLREGIFFLNPDEIARALNPGDVRASAIEAGRMVLNYSNQLVDAKRSFAIESTLSGLTPLKLLHKAKTAGYKTLLIYITTGNPEINIKRVEMRVANGGHHIAISDIIRRFHRSIASLPDYLKRVDEAFLVDNSLQIPRLVVQLEAGIVVKAYAPVPKWTRSVLAKLA